MPGRETDRDIHIETLNRIEQEVKDLADAVYGNDREGRDGLIKDMKVVHVFILKWDKREYLVRWIALLLGSNLFLTILGFAFMLLTGGG